MYMPETRGKDLEAIKEAFATHRVADVKVFKWLKKLASKMLGRGTRNSWWHTTSSSSSTSAGSEFELEVLRSRLEDPPVVRVRNSQPSEVYPIRST